MNTGLACSIKFNPPTLPPPPPLRFSRTKLNPHHHRRTFSSNANVVFLTAQQQQQQLIPRFSTINAAADASHSDSVLTSSIGSPPPSSQQWNLTSRHITLLNALACVVALSTSWLFLSAIPTLLAFKRSAESLEKLMNVMREELPDTMAAVRLSGMEISDLTMELSDLGQEITKGVRSSTQAVRVAEDRLRRLTTMVPNALVQQRLSLKTETVEPVLAKTARNLREGIVKGRAFLQMFFSITRFSKFAMNYLAARRQKS